MRNGLRLFAVVMLAMSLAATAAAQGKKREREPQLRTVRGTVVDKDENPVAAGIVYLKNLKSREVKTHFSDDEGRYRFSGLDPNVDYEIHAAHEEMISAKRTISSFDSRKEMVVNLKVDKKKEEK